MWRGKTGKSIPKMRRIAGLEALDEAVGRAAETGRPVHYTEGHPMSGKLYYTEQGPQYIAGLSILAEVARLAARKGARLVCSIGHSELLPLVMENIETAYSREGKAGEWNASDIHYFPEQGYTFGTVGIMEREKIAANILAGTYWGQDSIILPEVGAGLHAIQIGATATMGTLPWFIAACDYCLIGEELFAAGAFLSNDPLQLGCIVGQDLAKIYSLALIILGTIMTSLGIPILSTLVRR